MSKNSRTGRASIRTATFQARGPEPQDELVSQAELKELETYLSWCLDWCTEEDYESMSKCSAGEGGYESQLLAWDQEEETAEQAAHLTWWESVA